MDNIKECLNEALKIDGSVGVALGDWSTGFSLGQATTNPRDFPQERLEQAIALNSEVIKAKNKTREALGISAPIEDILITLKNQYHLIRICDVIPGVFLYLVMNREKANLGLARLRLQQLERKLRM